jgi:hypothetical protein
MKRIPAGNPGGGQFAPDPANATPRVMVPTVLQQAWERNGVTEMGEAAIAATQDLVGPTITQQSVNQMAARLSGTSSESDTPAVTGSPISVDMEPLDALTRLDDAVVAGDTRALLTIARDRSVAAYHSYLTDEPAREVWGEYTQDMLLALHTSPDPYTRAQVARDPECPPHLLRVLATDREPSVARPAQQALNTSAPATSAHPEDLQAAAQAAGRGFDDMLRRMRIVEKRIA